MRTGVFGAFVEGALGLLFPSVQGAVTVRAPITGFTFAMAVGEGGQSGTDFAAHLGALFAIVEVKKLGRGLTLGAARFPRQRVSPSTPHGSQGLAVGFLVLAAQLPPVGSRHWPRRSRRLPQGGLGIDVEIPIVGMLFSKLVTRFDLRFSLGKEVLQLADDLFQFLTGKILTKPKNESCYLSHGGLSPGVFKLPFDYQREETKPPFLFSFSAESPGSPASAPKLWKLPPGGNGKKTALRFFPPSHQAWKTPAEFPTVPPASTAAGSRPESRENPGARGRKRGEKEQTGSSYRKINRLAA